MLRNWEIQILLLALVGVATIGTLVAAIALGFPAAAIVATTSILCIITFLLFTKWRYKELEKLSGYLRQIAGGDFHLDVRDNDEGELSILKNEIYKVTKMLAEHGEVLKRDKAKLTDAISDIAHQLKTPLTSMTIMVDLLRDKNLADDERIKFSRSLQMQLERMEWLVSSLLKLSKIDAGTIEFKKEMVQVKSLVEKAVEPLLIPMDIKSQTLQLKGNDEVTFIGDANWTLEALVNIIKNCIEHTHEGGEITINFSENPLYTEITISDNGKGIPKEDLPYIFQRFYKGKTASDDSVGIGLSMASTIVKNQQGDIEVISEPDKGTTFFIKFFKQVH